MKKCKTVSEAIAALKELPIASAQTLTMADREGKIVVVECNSENFAEIEPKINEDFVTTANNFNSEILKSYRTPEDIDDWKSKERYQTAKEALEQNKGSYSLEFAMDLLAGEYGFMCQYDRKKNADTVWSVVYDIKNHKVYRVEGNPSRKKYKLDERINL